VADESNPAPPVPPQGTPQQASTDASGNESPSAPPARGVRQQPWAISFVLFAAGFVMLIVASKIAPTALWGPVLKGFGAASCVVGFLLARRDRRLKL